MAFSSSGGSWPLCRALPARRHCGGWPEVHQARSRVVIPFWDTRNIRARKGPRKPYVLVRGYHQDSFALPGSVGKMINSLAPMCSLGPLGRVDGAEFPFRDLRFSGPGLERSAQGCGV